MPGINNAQDHPFGSTTKKFTMTSTFSILSLLLVSQMLIFGAQGDVIPEIATTGSILPEGYVAHTDIGVAYKIHTGEFVSWAEAEQKCTLDGPGAQLAVIDSAKKLEYATSQPLGVGVRHVGIQKVNGEWVSVTNAKIATSTIPWAAREGPSNDDSFFRLAMVTWADRDTGLMAGTSYFSGDYVCEIPLSK